MDSSMMDSKFFKKASSAGPDTFDQLNHPILKEKSSTNRIIETICLQGRTNAEAVREPLINFQEAEEKLETPIEASNRNEPVNCCRYGGTN